MKQTPQQSASRRTRLIRRFLSRTWQGLTVVGLCLVLLVAAIISPGLVQADVRLNESTVYVQKGDQGLIGTLNSQIDELADAAPVGTTTFDVLQQEETVLVHGQDSSTLVAFDPGRNRLSTSLQLPSNAQVDMRGGTLAVTSPDNGSVWFGDVQSIMGMDFQTQQADLEIGEFGVAAVTSEGDVIAVDVQNSELVRASQEEPEDDAPETSASPSTSLSPEGDDPEAQNTERPETREQRSELPFTIDADAPNVQLSAVGDKAVVLDANSGRVWVEGMDEVFEVSGAGSAQLAVPAPDALGGTNGARAIYATQAGLIAVTPDGPRSLSGQLAAEPVQPVQVNDCMYAAFGNQFVKRCQGQEPQIREIPELPANAQLRFHVNRDTVVLNDVISGTVWMVNKDMLMITQWEQVNPPAEDDPDATELNDEVAPPERSQDNQAPIAVDDNLAARAGRSTVLYVLDNDSDPDGDVLTITSSSEASGASLQPVRGGAGLQITLDAEATGDISFQYSIADGRGGTDTATVNVRVLPADPTVSNEAPLQRTLGQGIVGEELNLQLGSTVTKRVLLDWRDPDGDPLVLARAWLDPDAEDELSFTPQGEITFIDIGKTAGTKVVHIEVSDGYSSTEGELSVVVSEDPVAPLAFGDFATVRVGDTTTIEPLLNDVGAQLALTEVTEQPGCPCLVETDFREGSFTFSAEQPGTFYVTYNVSNPEPAQGVVRIDVLAQDSDRLPVAALDVALLPVGGSVTIDPLLNDTSPNGNVLVVQSVSQAPGLEVTLERRHVVTVTAQTRLQEPVTLTYWVSDGRNAVQGSIVVLPTSGTASVEPQAEDDTVLVRAGNTQTVDVLANDSSPIGLDLRVDKIVTNPLGDQVWIDGNEVRVSIPRGAGAGTVNLTYQIRDEEDRISSAQVAVTIVSEDDQNQPPKPRSVTERVLAGTSTRVAIPLEGIDANGDSVRVQGLGSGPKLGRVLSVGDGWMYYEAFPTSEGTDTVTYQVVDSLGAIGYGELRIGVAPPGRENNPPVGVSDEIMVRPGAPVQIAALRNDVDVDGDSISLTSTEPVIEIDRIDDIEVFEGREFKFTAPKEQGTYRGVYYIDDSRGMPGSGDVSVVVDADAPLLAPEARDDMVSVAAVLGKDFIEADVLANDFDPDGQQKNLRVRVPGASSDGQGPQASDDGRNIVVPIEPGMQQIRYEVVDDDQLTATALLTVPGIDDSVPALKDPSFATEVVAGQPLTINLNSLVSGTRGRSVRLTSVDNVSSTFGEVAPGPETLEYTPDVDYAGPASVVFEVVDVVPEGDRSARSAFISIPVTVLPAAVENGEDTTGVDDPVVVPPPEMIGDTPIIQVGPDEGESRRDLRPLFRVHTGGNFRFANWRAVEGDQRIEFEADQNGIVRAWGPLGVPPGTTRIIQGDVIDARGASLTFRVQLEMISSRMPPPVAANISIEEALAGEPVPVPALGQSKSNLRNDTSLTYVGEPVVVSGSGSAIYDGDNVVVTPGEGFSGTMTVSYTIVDATKDPSRNRDGTIRLTVKDRPGRPGAPRDGEVGNGTVTFTYTPGSSNGYEITDRIVTPITADGTRLAPQHCPSTTCTVTGLRNGVPHQFEMVEVNDAGESDPSPLSAFYTPDQKPLAPSIKITDFGDGMLKAEWSEPSWQDPSNPGSPVTAFTLNLMGADGGVLDSRQMGASARSFEWAGLTNGTSYRFSITATNAAGTSDASQPSNTDYPAAPPGASSRINATPKETELGGAFDVTFSTDAATNGDAVKEWFVVPITESGSRQAGQRVAASGSGEITTTIDGLGQEPYRFAVYGVNKAGDGESAETSQYQVAWKLPKVESDPEVTAGDGSLSISFATNFDDIPEANPTRQYNIGAGWQPLGDGTITGLTNGRTYSVAVRVLVENRISAERSAGQAMPRSAEPLWPTRATAPRLRGENEIVVGYQRPTSLEETGGWSLEGLVASCGPRCRGTGPQWVVDGSSDVTISFTHEQSDAAGTLGVELERPTQLSFDPTTKALNIVLRYVDGARCTVASTDGTFSQTFNQSGQGDYVLETTLTDVETPEVEVTCLGGSIQIPIKKRLS